MSGIYEVDPCKKSKMPENYVIKKIFFQKFLLKQKKNTQKIPKKHAGQNFDPLPVIKKTKKKKKKKKKKKNSTLNITATDYCYDIPCKTPFNRSIISMGLSISFLQ